MALELKQTVGLSQQLVITPQLQQAIKLLQLSRLELLETVQQELIENPVLEEQPGEQNSEEEPMSASTSASPEEASTEPEPTRDVAEEVGTATGEMKEPTNFDWENYIGTYNAPGMVSNYLPEDLPTYENTLTKTEDLQEHLVWQLQLSGLSSEEERIGLEIIGNINDDGYLRTELSEIAGKDGWSIGDVERILKKVQAMDPLGVGARDLAECLLLQIQLYENSTDRAQLTELISKHLNLLEKRDYPSVARLMKLPLRRVYQLAKWVSELEPKPGRPYGGETTHYITPDVYVHKMARDYVVVLNEEGLPRLQVSHFYRNLLARNDTTVKHAGTKEYVQDKLRSAMWLIKSIHQRQRTLYKVTKCIVKFQRDFLDQGVLHLKPMILRDVADEIGVHESTVSRATSNKYVHTPQGIFELKYFFNSGVSSGDGAGDHKVAVESVKSYLRHIISIEDPKHPHSDQEIVDLLKQSNVDIARRTVAKYREILGILPSSKRKQLF